MKQAFTISLIIHNTQETSTNKQEMRLTMKKCISHLKKSQIDQKNQSNITNISISINKMFFFLIRIDIILIELMG